MRSRAMRARSEEHTSELQSHLKLVCRLLLEKKKPRRVHHPRPGAHRCDRGHRGHLEGRPHEYGHDQPPRLRFLHLSFFFFNDTAPTEIYPLSLPDALPISPVPIIAVILMLLAPKAKAASVAFMV